MPQFILEQIAGGSYLEAGDYLELDPQTHNLTADTSTAAFSIAVPMLRLSHPLTADWTATFAVDQASLLGTIPLTANVTFAAQFAATNLRLSNPLTAAVLISLLVEGRFDPIPIPSRLGANGLVLVRPRLYRADRYGNPIEDLSAYVDGGSVTVDLDRDVSGTFRVRLRDRDQDRPASRWVGSRLAPYKDWLLLTVARRYAGGREEEESLGLFAVDVPGQEVWPSVTYLDVTGRDPTWTLTQDRIADPLTMGKGLNLIDFGNAVINRAAIALPPVSAPPSPRTAPAEMNWKAGTDRLTIANDCYEGAGYYPVKADAQGQLYTMPYLRLVDIEPKVVFDAGPGSVVVPPVDLSPTTTQVRNHIVVSRADPRSTPIRVERVAPATSPVAMERIGMRLSRYINDPHLADATAAAELADRMIEEGASYYQRMRLTTVPTDAPGRRDAVTVNLTDQDGVGLPGLDGAKLWRSGWSMSLAAGGTMSHSLNRLVSVGT